MAELSRRVRENIYANAMRDLRPSLVTLYFKSGLAVLLGGVLSLFVCGQFGMAMTPQAAALSHKLHSSMDVRVCAVVCGVTFALFPVLLLKLMCRELQFRAIVRRGYHAPLVWITGVGALMSYQGDHGREMFTFLLWCVAAWTAFELAGRGIDAVAVQLQRARLGLSRARR